jgi:hypothetical protein
MVAAENWHLLETHELVRQSTGLLSSSRRVLDISCELKRRTLMDIGRSAARLRSRSDYLPPSAGLTRPMPLQQVEINWRLDPPSG